MDLSRIVQRLKPFKTRIIGGTVILIVAGVFAFSLLGHGAAPDAKLSVPVADKDAGSQGGPTAGAPLQQMDLQGQYAGPLKDTIIQRWRDPQSGMICYIYLPMMVHHTKPLANGLVEYGANHIGTISCVPPR